MIPQFEIRDILYNWLLNIVDSAAISYLCGHNLNL